MKIETFEALQEYVKRFLGAQGYVRFISQPGVRMFSPSEELREYPVEMGLWDETGRVSVHIRFMEGTWYVDETQIPKSWEEDDLQTCLSHIEGKKVKMLQIWQKEPDPFCEGFEVQRFVKNVFVGFEEGGRK